MQVVRAARCDGPRGCGGGGRRLCGRQEEAAGVLAADSTREVEAEKTSQGVRARVDGGAGQAAQGLCVRFLQKEPVAQGPSEVVASAVSGHGPRIGRPGSVRLPAEGKTGEFGGAARPRMWSFQRCHPGAAARRAVGTFGVDAGGMDACTGGRRQPVELLQECAWSHRNRQRLKHEQASAFPSRQLHHTHTTTSVQRYAVQRSRTLPHFGPARD